MEDRTELIKALCQFHLTVGRITKTQAADRYHYATLASVLDVIRQPMLDAHLAYTQTFEGTDLVTTLWHTSGQCITSRLTLPAVEMRGMNQCQALGSAISYCRRYSLLSLLGLATEDNDGADLPLVASVRAGQAVPVAEGVPF